MTTDPLPDREDGAPDLPGWLSLRDVALAIGIGLVLAAVLAAITPGALTHLLGGTDLRETTVAAVEVGPRSEDTNQVTTSYDLRWSDDGETRTASFRHNGPPRRDVGDTWELWVSPDGSSVETTSPRTTLLWLGIGLPVFALLIGTFVRWRGRVVARSALREADRIEKDRTRRTARS